MKIKVKSIIIILISIFLLLQINFNFYIVAEESEKDKIYFNDSLNNLRGNEASFWEQIEIISEPNESQNINILESNHTKIAVENDNIYVVWHDKTDINGSGEDYDIFYRYFDGQTWSKIQVISEPIPGNNLNNMKSMYPEITVENGKIYVVWYDQTSMKGSGTDLDIFFRCNLTGSKWEEIQIISEPADGKNFNWQDSVHPSIAVENSKIYVVWYDWNNTNGAWVDADIFYRCNITGTYWEQTQVISEPVFGADNNNGWSYHPDLDVENDNIYVVWADWSAVNGAGTDSDIFYRYNSNGLGWGDIQVISEPVFGNDFNYAGSGYPSIAVNNNNIYVAWYDGTIWNGAGIDNDIFYRCNLTGNNWEEIQVISEPVFNMNYNTGESVYPSLAAENNKIFVTWQDNNNTKGVGADYDIFYRCNITGSNWNNIQIVSEPTLENNKNTHISCWPDIKINLNRVFIVWVDENNTNNAGTDADIFYRSTPKLLNLDKPNVTPTSGNTSTYFNFTVIYRQIENVAPTEIKININGINNSMLEVNPSDTEFKIGKRYYYQTRLNIGDNHTFRFWASDGNTLINTDLINLPDVYNTFPMIITENNVIAMEDTYYDVQYEYDDIDKANVGQSGAWHLSTNATWLTFNPTTAILYGTPTNDEVGKYGVHIEINDTIDIDFTNFTLTVIDVNDDPIINTTDIKISYEDELYEIDYNAMDLDSIINHQIWSLKTNATSWLDIESSSGILSGTPTNDEVGNYVVNVSVADGEGGFDFADFILTVRNVNDPPTIITNDILIARTNYSYIVDYNAIDIDPTNDTIIWSLETNANWLGIDSITGVLTGIPNVDDIGVYSVEVIVDDGEGGVDSHKFILTVQKGNEPPIIITSDFVSTTVNILYYVDYEAIDDRTSLEYLDWSLKTNASWLSIVPNRGLLSGTPALKDIGTYWVNVSVFDDEDGWDYSNFTLLVTTEQIIRSPPVLSDPNMSPTVGDTKTEFIFSVNYYHPNEVPPDSIQVIIDGIEYNMNYSGGYYEYKTKLSEGNHTYNFITTLDHYLVNTNEFDTGYINKANGVKPEDVEQDNTLFYVGFSISLIIIIIMILLFIFSKKKEEKKEGTKPLVPAEIIYRPPSLSESSPRPIVQKSKSSTVSIQNLKQLQPELPSEEPPIPKVVSQVPQPQINRQPTLIPQIKEQPQLMASHQSEQPPQRHSEENKLVDPKPLVTVTKKDES